MIRGVRREEKISRKSVRSTFDSWGKEGGENLKKINFYNFVYQILSFLDFELPGFKPVEP